MKLTAKQLAQSLEYDPVTGDFCYAAPRGRMARGDVAGTMDADGYVVVKVRGRTYRAHRLAWLAVYGAWPHCEIDHANGNRADNRIANLRLASRSQNMQNTSRSSANRSGYVGVAFHRATGKFQANITLAGRTRYLGLFASAEDASNAYRAAKSQMHAFDRMERGE